MDVIQRGPIRRIDLDRGEERSTIDDELVASIHDELRAAEADPANRIVVLASRPGTFSTGMNLVAAGRSAGTGGDPGGDPGSDPGSDSAERSAGAFFDLLRRFTESPRIVVSVVDGVVAGGGVGLVAASDLVFATERSTFALPEGLWGLLPCCVLPYLVRRIGFQRAYAMALTTQTIDAEAAARAGLVDELGPDPESSVRRLAFRASKLDPGTIGALKRYAGKLWEISDETRGAAVGELERLMALPAVRERLAAFAERGRFPWESRP